MGASNTKNKFWVSEVNHPIYGQASFIQFPNAKSPDVCVRLKISDQPKDENSPAYWENLAIFDPDSSVFALPSQISYKENNYDIPEGVLELIFENYTFTFDHYITSFTSNNPFVYEVVLLHMIGSVANALLIAKKAGVKHLCVCQHTIILKANGNWVLAPPMPSRRTLSQLNSERAKNLDKNASDVDKRKAGLKFAIAPEIAINGSDPDEMSDIYSLGMTMLHAINPIKDTNSSVDQNVIFEKLKAVSSYYSGTFIYLLTRMTRTDRSHRISLEELVSSLETMQHI